MAMLAKYEREELIGSGTFGNVWLVRSRSNNSFYVLKEVLLTSMNSVERQQALTEVSVLARCRHRNIIRYKEAMIEHEKDMLSIVMEYAEGGDLYTAIKKQNGSHFNENEVLSWFVQISFALQYIHSHNILHRDLKSQNIFLTRAKLVKLGDFGIARVLESERELATTAIGTPYYLSPEICQRKPYNYKSDIWALGCVLYEMVALVHPFQAQSFHQLVIAILKANYKAVPSESSPLVHDLISILINVDPDKRPSTDEILAIPALQPHVYKYLNSCKTDPLGVECTDTNMMKSPRRYSTTDVLKDVKDAIRLKRRASISIMKRDGAKSQRPSIEKENVPSKPRSMSSPRPPTEKKDYRQSPLISIGNLKNMGRVKHSSLPTKEEDVDDSCKPSSGTYRIFKKSSGKSESSGSQSSGAVELKSSGETDVGYQSGDIAKTDISVITKTKNSFKNLFVKSNSSSNNKGIIRQKDLSSEVTDSTKKSTFKEDDVFKVRGTDVDTNLRGNETITKERLVERSPGSSLPSVSNHCPHSIQCQQCLFDVLWVNRIRGSSAVQVDVEETERLRSKLEAVFGLGRFRKMYVALSSEWQECSAKSVTLHSLVQSSSLEHVQHFPLLLQLLQIDQLQKSSRDEVN